MGNLAININQIVASNSKFLIQSNIIKELSLFIENEDYLLDGEKKQIIYWVLRFMKFHNQQHPSDLVQTDIESFLSSLATESHYNQKLQKSAEYAIKFLYQSFLKRSITQLNYISVQQRKGYLSYFGEKKCQQVVKQLSGKSLLMIELMLLGNLKLSEVASLRTSDIDIKNNRINIYSRENFNQDQTKLSVKENERKLLFTIIIPLKLVLDLRIQKMRIKQLFGDSRVVKNGAQSRVEKNSLLFHSNESFFNHSLQIEKIKQSFKKELKRAINIVKKRAKHVVYKRKENRFNQLRCALGPLSNPKTISSSLYTTGVNKSYQLELEVA